MGTPHRGLFKVLAFHMWANVAGLPALTIPAGHDTAGPPMGVQLVGRPDEDERLLEIASALEAAIRP